MSGNPPVVYSQSSSIELRSDCVQSPRLDCLSRVSLALPWFANRRDGFSKAFVIIRRAFLLATHIARRYLASCADEDLRLAWLIDIFQPCRMCHIRFQPSYSVTAHYAGSPGPMHRLTTTSRRISPAPNDVPALPAVRLVELILQMPSDLPIIC